ncbi:uncharacterized protein LOC132390784 [Hypanus sabinus]|uniref:uncharacterized protein LOC132390784 n=1 Tax=Hypanus sabinus TaxID=79690 RepID=UPI0028C4FE1B|nr:uncharacterized protein LOC132390784 [Hypanus sabinus]
MALERKKSCDRCTREHCLNQRPTYGKICNGYGEINHFSRCCKGGKKENKMKQVNAVLEDECEEFYIDVLCENKQSKNDWANLLQVNQSNILLKLDTGVQVNVLAESEFNTLKPRLKLHQTNIKVIVYSGADIPVKGTCVAKVSHKNIVHTLSFVFIPKNVQSILGLSACERLNLVKRVLVLDSDTELKQQNVALQSAEGDVTQLQVQFTEANTDMENIKVVAAVSEMTKQEAIDDMKKQWQEEVASMQAIMKETLREYKIQFHHHLEQERSQWALYKKEVKAQVKELRSFIAVMKSQHKKRDYTVNE